MLFNAFSFKKKKRERKGRGGKIYIPFEKGLTEKTFIGEKKFIRAWKGRSVNLLVNGIHHDRAKTRTVSSTQSEKWCSRCWDSDEFEVDDGWMRLLRSWNTTFEYEFKLLLGKNLCCWRCFFLQRVVRDYGNDGWWFSFLLIKISKIYSFIVNGEDVESLILRNREG